MEKNEITADDLRKIWEEHNLTITMLASKMGVSEGIVRGCFKHTLNRHGKPLRFSKTNLEKLNAAMDQIAQELRNSIITFGSDKTYTNQLGNTYDPGTLESINHLGTYFNMKKMVMRVLGWTEAKRFTVLSVKNSPVYGNVTREDIVRINTELLAVAGVLSSSEVVAEESPTQSHTTTLPKGDGAQAQVAETKTDKKQTGKRTEVALSAYPWDDTALLLSERSRLFREQFPGGVLLFRVNGGYTAEGDDALLLQQMDSSIVPYTDVETELVTAWMDNEQMSNILPRIISHNKRVMFTDMYAKE